MGVGWGRRERGRKCEGQKEREAKGGGMIEGGEIKKECWHFKC